MGATRILIVANPAAAVRRVSVRWPSGPGDAFRIAESSVDDVVVAVGGDGTVRDVAAGLAAG